MDGYATVVEAARITDRARQVIYQACEREAVRAAIVDGRYLVCIEDVDALPRATRLSDADVTTIRERHAAGESQRALGRAYGVTHSHISRIVRFEKRIGRHGAIQPQ